MIFNKKRQNLLKMKAEDLKEFLKSQNVYWHGSVLNKKGELFTANAVREIKKGSKLDLTIAEQGKRTMYDVEFGLNYFVISSVDKDFMLFLSDKWIEFLDNYTANEDCNLSL